MKRTFMWAVGACLMACALVFVSGCDSRDDQAEMPKFPDHTTTRVQLRPEADREAIRYDFYSDDKKTKLGTQIEYVDGVTTFLAFRPDSTIAQLKEFYPAPEGKQRQLKRVIVYAADGKSYLSDKTWRLDGTRNYIGERLSDGTYELRYFYEDGVKTLRHRLIDSDKRLIAEGFLRKDGTIEKEIKRLTGDTIAITTYSPTRTKLSYETRTGGQGEATYYYEDGTTLRMHVNSVPWMVTQRSYDRQGNVTESREYSYYGMSVTVYKNGVESYRQRWQVDAAASKTAGKRVYVLQSVEELSANGKTVVRKIEFGNTGKPSRVTYPVDGKYWAGKTVVVRDDGTTSEVTVRDDDGDVVSSKKYSEKDNVREKFDNKRFEQQPFEEPEKVKELKTMPFRRFGF